MIESMEQDELAEFDVTEDEFDAMLADSEPAEVAGPFDPVRRVRFELISGSLRTYRWRLVAANGEILAISATSYRSPEDVRRALSTLTVAMREASIVDADETDEPASHRRAS
jgi:uncharacterized protein YegP (UPF0339 family)